MKFDRDKVLQNAQKAGTEDLLDRLTAYRAGMEPEALEVIEAELRSRGVTTAQIREHEERQEREALWEAPGLAARCSFCARPAVARGWRWHRLWGLMPLFPRPANYCKAHLPPEKGGEASAG